MYINHSKLVTTLYLYLLEPKALNLKSTHPVNTYLATCTPKARTLCTQSVLTQQIRDTLLCRPFLGTQQASSSCTFLDSYAHL
jgi:hypothetical protein